MKKPKPRKKRTPVRDPKAPVYTHQDSSGMPWRMVGSRPVSALADSVMRDCGFPLR
jgi:hypothetical protein